MRWYVRTLQPGQNTPVTHVVEAAHWQGALMHARELRNEGDLRGLAVEVVPTGCTAYDPERQLRYLVERAPDDVLTSSSPGARPPAPVAAQPQVARRPKTPLAGSRTMVIGSQGAAEFRAAVEEVRQQRQAAAATPAPKPARARTMAFAAREDIIPRQRATPTLQSRPPESSSPPPTERGAPLGMGGTLPPPPGPAAQAAAAPPTPRPARREQTRAMAARGAAVVAPAAGSSEPSPATAPPPSPAPAAAVTRAMVAQPDRRPTSEPDGPSSRRIGGVRYKLLTERSRDATDVAPLTYRERIFGVQGRATLAELEEFVFSQFEIAREELKTIPRGRAINIAVLDHVPVTRPERPPIVICQWKDWRGRDPSVVFFPYGPKPFFSAAEAEAALGSDTAPPPQTHRPRARPSFDAAKTLLIPTKRGPK